MEVLRMWPLAFGIAIPGIILLYMLKQRVSPQEYSALNLWKEAYENMQATTPWERFKNQILMYLQILAVLLLVVALMSPFLKNGTVQSNHVILFIDNSASMNGNYEEEKTKLEVAKEQAWEYVKSAGQGCQITVISSAATGKLELADSTDKDKLKKAIEGIRETDQEGSLNYGISMVESMAEQLEDYEVVAFTDSDFDMKELKGNVVDLSLTGENVAVEYVSHKVQENGNVIVMALVTNYGISDVEKEVDFYIGEDLIEYQTLSIKAGESLSVYFEEVPKSRYQRALEKQEYLKIEVAGKDLLMRDNISYDILTASQVKKVLLVTEQNTFLEKALKGNSRVTVDKTDSPNIYTNEDGEGYDLIIYDGMLPKKWADGTNLIFINPPEDIMVGGNASDKKENDVLIKASGVKKNTTVQSMTHDVTMYLEQYEFGCKEVTLFEQNTWGETIFQIEEKYPTGIVGSLDKRRIAVLGFNLHHTDFPLQTEFPIFMYHLLDYCLEQTMIAESTINAGNLMEIRTKKDAKKVIIDEMSTGNRKELSLEDGVAIYEDTWISGIYRLNQDKEKEYFIVDFPNTESSFYKKAVITATNTENLSVNSDGEIKRARGTSLMLPVLILLMVLLGVEWSIYRKNV